MALTPQEAAELARLEGEDGDARSAQASAPVHQALDNGAHAATRGFSLYHATVGAVRDAFQNVLDLGNAAQRVVGEGGLIGRPNLGDNFLTRKVLNPQAAINKLDTAEDPNAPLAEKVIRTGLSWMLPFAGASRALGAARAGLSLGSRLGRGLLASVAADVTLKPSQTNPVNIVADTPAAAKWFSDHFGIDEKTLHSLASEEDDDSLTSRFKAAALALPLNFAGDLAVEGLHAGVTAFKAWKSGRGAAIDTKAAIDALEADMTIRPGARAAAEQAAQASEALRAETKAAAEGPVQPDLFTPVKAGEDGASSLSDVASFLERKATEGATDEEAAAMHAALTGNPSEAFEHALGIDPLKIDWSDMDKPEVFNSVTESLQKAYTAIANRLGRTGERVTAEMTAKAARALASTPTVLKQLYEKTNNLAAVVQASNMLVGGHTVHLVDLAEKAMAAAKAGVDNGEWSAFLEAFHRHAYFLGTLRGAGSESGRALQAWKQVQKGSTVSKVIDSGILQNTVKKATKAQAKAVPEEAAAAATNALGRITSDAEKIGVLSNIVHNGVEIGDISQLARVESAETGATLFRREGARLLKGAINESRGNLFSLATGAWNAVSAVGIGGLRALAMADHALGLLLEAPLSREAAREARVQLYATFFYVEGAIGGLRQAWREAEATIGEHLYDELARNANGLGAKGLARKAAARSADLKTQFGEEFERVDVTDRTVQFKMSASDLRRMHDEIDSWDYPSVLSHTIKWITNIAAAGVNAAGTIQRVPTILSILGADRFAGGLIKRAGQQAEAIRLAASDALEGGLQGKQLGQYMRGRMTQLTDPNAFIAEGTEGRAYWEGQRRAVLKAGTTEAVGALAQDDLRLGINRAITHLVHQTGPIGSFFVPFVKTPLRLMEITALDYTPLGALTSEFRQAFMAGGWRRDEAISRMALGTMMVATAFQLAEDRTIVGLDGDYKSSARLTRPSYTLKVGDDYVEFKRTDPHGTLLGWGADLRQITQLAAEKDPDGVLADQYIRAAIVATSNNIFQKTWLTGLKNLTDLVGVTGDSKDGSQFARSLQSMAQRFVPAAGYQKTLGNDPTHMASTFMERLLVNSVGADRLPLKRDFLGRPEVRLNGDQALGIKAGPNPSKDDLDRELERLSFDLPMPSHKLEGVDLNSTQYSRLLQLRGAVVQRDGMTLQQRLAYLITLPEYQALPHLGRVKAMRDEMRGYQRDAEQQLVTEDHGLARKVGRAELVTKAVLQGTPMADVDRQTQELFQQLGLTDDRSTIPDQTKP